MHRPSGSFTSFDYKWTTRMYKRFNSKNELLYLTPHAGYLLGPSVLNYFLNEWTFEWIRMLREESWRYSVVWEER